MTTQHTPGPWDWFWRGVASTPDWEVFSEGKLICRLAETNTENAQEMRANARLIAAAPELLAALEVMLAAYDIGQGATDTSALGLARAAIAKVKGVHFHQ